MVRKWKKVAAFGRKITSPRADEHFDFNSCSTSSVTEKGHFNVYTTDRKRFMIPLAYLKSVVFTELLKILEEEFGFAADGAITFPCDALSMEYVLSLLRKAVSEEMERAFPGSISMSCPSKCSNLTVDNTQQLAVCSF